MKNNKVIDQKLIDIFSFSITNSSEVYKKDIKQIIQIHEMQKQKVLTKNELVDDIVMYSVFLGITYEESSGEDFNLRFAEMLTTLLCNCAYSAFKAELFQGVDFQNSCRENTVLFFKDFEFHELKKVLVHDNITNY
jgi:hypothetical protein